MDKPDGYEIEVNGDLIVYPATTLRVDFWYPRLEHAVKHVEVGLSDVRAADSIRIHYDFDRDGYVIEQASRFEWDAADEVCDPGWKEVAFVQAWALQEPSE